MWIDLVVLNEVVGLTWSDMIGMNNELIKKNYEEWIDLKNLWINLVFP